jgi:hypothetical protein
MTFIKSTIVKSKKPALNDIYMAKKGTKYMDMEEGTKIPLRKRPIARKVKKPCGKKNCNCNCGANKMQAGGSMVTSTVANNPFAQPIKKIDYPNLAVNQMTTTLKPPTSIPLSTPSMPVMPEYSAVKKRLGSSSVYNILNKAKAAAELKRKMNPYTNISDEFNPKNY